MFHFKVHTCVFEKLKLKETCLPYFVEGFKNKIY